MRLVKSIRVRVLRQVVGRHFNILMRFNRKDVICGRAVATPMRNIKRFRPLHRCTRIRLHLRPKRRKSKVRFTTRYDRSVLSEG